MKKEAFVGTWTAEKIKRKGRKGMEKG